jgi:hypothetical protein
MLMTKKTLALLFIVVTAALSARAQTPAGWVKFSPPGSPFTVLMPSEPTEEKKTSPSPHGPFTTYLYTTRTPDREIYLVGWVDYDPNFKFGVQAELEANRDNFVKAVKATLLSTTPIKLGANPGIEFKAELTGRVDIVSRVYIVGRRPYQLIMITPAGSDADARRERFFSSFKLGAAR